MPASRAWRMRSHTIRKYELKPIAAIVSSSYWMRWRAVSDIVSPQRRRAPSHVTWAR